MASAPLWSEIESNPQFSSLTPEQKIESLNKWTDETLQLTEDPAQQELVAAFADRKKRRLSGEKLPETPLAEYLPVFREAKRLEAANQQGFLSQMGGALSTGLGETLTGVKGAFNAYTGDTADVAASLAESNRLAQEKALAKTSKDIAYEKELEQQATEFKNAQGFWPTAKELLDYLVITGKNPTAALKMGLSSAPNVLVSFGGQMAGSAIGALAGAATGPGAFASTLAGMVAGGAAINTALETQPQIYEKLLEATKGAAANMTAPEIEKVLQENPSIVTEGIKKGAIRGATIGLVESLFTKAAGRIVGAPQRAQAAAVSKWAASKGLPEGEALKTILRQNPELAKEAAEQAAIALRPFTKTGDVARLAGAGLAETLGEGAGEAAALKVTEGEIDPTAVYQEMIGAGVVSGATAGTLKILEKSGSAFGKLAKAGELVDRASQNNNAQGATEAALQVISQADQETTNKEQDELNQNESEQQLQLNLGNIEAPRSRQALAQVPGQQEFGFVSQADLGTAPRREAEGQMELPFGQAPATAAAAAQQLELPLRSEERGTGQMELGLNVARNQPLPKQKATRTPKAAPQGQQLEMDFETPQDPFQPQTPPTDASQIQVQEAGRVPPVESQPVVQPPAVQAQEGTAQRQGQGQEEVVSRVSSGKPGGAVVETEFDFVEADELANLLQIEVNKDQTRDRKRNRASEEQITQIAADPDPILLGDSPISSVGAPVVERDAILAGNGRAAGLIRGYQGNTAGIQKYRENIQQKAAGMGRDISGMKNPVMIRRVRGYVAGDRRSFVTESNPKYSGLQETTTEAALLDAEALGGNLGSIEFNENGQLTSSSAQQVATKFAQAQRAVNATSSGKLDTAEATRRVQLAALALLAKKANLDIGELTSFIETDIGKRTLSEVIRVAPSLTSLDTDLSLADSLLPALKVFNQGVMAVNNGAFANLNEWNQNRANELVQEDITPEGNALVEAMVSAVRKSKTLRDLFETYVERATSEQQKRQESQQSDDIFGESRQNVPGNQILASVLQEAPEKAPELNLEPTPATEELPVQAEAPAAEAAPTVEPAAEAAPAVEEAAPAEEPSKQVTFTRTQRDELNRIATDFLAQNGISLDAPLTKAQIEALQVFLDEYLASEASADIPERTRMVMETLSTNLGREARDFPKAPKKPKVAAKPSAKREAPTQSREQARAKREADYAKRKADLNAKLAKYVAVMKKFEGGFVNVEPTTAQASGSPTETVRTAAKSPPNTREFLTAALDVAKVLAEMGVVTFSEFAAQMKELLPNLWDLVKRYLTVIWEQLEASPRPKGAAAIEPISEEEANRIIAELDGKAAPATEEAPAPAAAPSPVAEAPVEKEPPVSKPNLTEPVEKTVPADEPNVEVSNSEWAAKIGFGQSKNKSFREVFDEGNFNYLFSSLFSEEVLARAFEKSRPEILRVRETVKKLPQYKEYLADKAKTPAELKAERESLVEDYATALNTLKRFGMDATVDPNTQEVIVTKPLSKTLQENAGKFGALYYDSNRAKYVGRNYAKLIDFAKRAATGSFEKSDSIRQEVWRTRQAVFDSVDMSAQTPAFTENSNPTTEKLLKMYTDAVANGFLSSKSAQSQMVDATMIDTAHANGKPMFLLGSEAGYGKTFVIGSAIDRILSRSDKPLRVVYVTKNQQLISQAKNDLKNHEKVGSIEFITYNEMGKMTDKTMPEADILVFDEAHTVRYNIQGDASSWAITAGKLMAKASFSIVATATPYENIQQMRFLWPTGVFKPFQGKFLPATENESLAEKGWFDFAIAAGAKATQMDRPNPSLKFESNAGEAKQDAFFAREFLRKNGMFSFRASDIPSELVDMNFVAVEGAPEWESLSKKVLKAFNYGRVGATAKAYMVNLLKRILEQSKLPQAVDLANKELTESDNSRIVIFTETRSKRERDLQQMVNDYQEFRKTGVRNPKADFPDDEEVIKAFDALTELGVDKILFQSVQERFQNEFGDQAVFYTGGEEAGARKDAVEDWNAGKSRILIATMAAGGTGLSLHDKSKGGQFPRVQINVNLPWVGSEIEQVTRRTARTGMTSKAKIYWLFANNLLNEGQLAQTAGNRLHGLNLLVRGDISPSVEGIRNYQFNPIDGVTQADDVLAPEDNPPSDTTEQNVDNAKAIQTETSRIERSIEPLSESDEAYLAAVEAGDMETAQRMVDEAARAAGYTVKAWHGTWQNDEVYNRRGKLSINTPFTVFDMEAETSTSTSIRKLGFFFGSDRETAETYAQYAGVKKVGGKPRVISAFLNLGDSKKLPFSVASELMNYGNLPEQKYKTKKEAEKASDKLKNKLETLGYNSIIFSENNSPVELVVFNPSQIKSADPVTYDDAGNVIPLSQRFQETSPDIRKSAELATRESAVTPEEFARGMRYVQSLINGARAMVIYDTLDNLLKRGDITAAEKSALREARTQAIYSNGRAIIATNRVRKSAQYKTPEQAAAAVVFHELMHGGSDILRNDPKYAQMYGEWVSMLNDNVTKGMLQSLVTRGGYSGFADWETNPTSKLRAMEEIFVRQVTSLYNRKGDLAFKEQSAFQRFKNWIRRLVNSVLGTNFQYGIDDAILSEWGRKFIVAISTSNLVFNTQQSIERFMGDVDVPVRPSGNDNLLSTFSEAEKERLYAYMEGNKSFSKLKQVLGLNGSGELGDVESLAPLREAAMREIGFSDTGSGPKVSTIATQNAIRIATELTNPSSNFGAAYQQRFGAESAATAVLQMELTKYALAMARKNDKRLLNLLKKNWNSIVLGSYTTATSSGRILNVRSRYVSEVLSTIDRMNEERSNLAGEALEQTGLTPEAANTLLRNINTLVAQAELDDSMREALFREIGQTVIREGENDSNSYAFIDVALESLDKDRQRKLLAILKTLKQRAEIVKALRERGDSTIERSLDDEFGTAANYASMSTQELQSLLAENDSSLNAAFASYENASNKQPIKRNNPPKPVMISAAAQATLEQQLADNDRKLDQEIADYEDFNEAEEAVKKNIDRLKAFIRKEHKAVDVPETVFEIISKVVKEAVANPENYSFSDFRDALEGELSQFDINPDLMEELVSTSYSAFARFPEKDAERLTKGLLEAARKKKIVTTPSDVAKLRSLVTEAVRNRDILGPDAFLSNFIPKVEALGVPTPQAKSLVEAAYQRSVQLRNEALQRKADRIKTALLDGSRNRFLDSIVGTPTPEQLLDIDWRRSTMLSLLTRSGLADIEAQRVLSAIDSNDITRILTKQVDPNLAKIASDKLNKVVESFTKKYEDDVKTLEAELKDPNKRRKRNLKLLSLKGLVKNQVRVPLDFDLFSAEAAKFGASRDQAAKLFDLAKQEAELSKMKTGKIPTKLGKVINYVLQNPTIRNNPDARMLALESFLRDNGYDEGQIKDALSSFKGIFDKYIKMAKEKAMTDYVNSLDKARVRKEKVAAQKAKYVGDITEMSDSAYNQLKSDLELIRKGLASSEIDPDQTLAKKLGFDGFLEGDERSLAELDLKITNAMADGRAHDMAEGLRELYELISRRKAPKRLREVIAITMNNNALSGPSTIMVNVMSPLGSFITRVIIDIGKSIATGDMRKAWLSASIAFDSLKKAMSEIAYGLRDGGASTVAMNQQVQRVTTLQGDVAKASITMRDKKAPKWARLKATYIYASGFTDIVRRLLSTLDHTAFAVFQNYFLRTNTATLLEKVGKTKEEMVPVLFANSERARSLIANENALINRVASALQSVNYSKNESLAAIDAIMAEDSGTTNRDYLNFKSDFLGAVRRTVNAYNDSIQKFTTREIRRQQNMVYLRANDRTNRDMLDALSNSFSSSEDGQGAVEDLRRFTQNESEYELGVHLGEEAPGLDVINLAVNSIREAGQYVVQKNPIFGRMLLGYFGIPANLLNRAMWYTPYGLLRLAINRFANGKGKFYQQSMQTQAQIRQRVTETLIGTAGIALILGIKAMGEDDDEGFNVTLNGPTNKTERDAWRKNGHKENSLEYVTKDGTVISVNWGRGFLESFKVALLMVGVVDDLKLNRKIGEDAKAAAIGDYLAAFMYGWSKQAAFFGAKSTIGAVATPQADASLIGTALYKTNPLLPFSGLVAGIEKMIAGPDLYRGGNNAPLYLNIPIARSLFSERAINALGDPQGLVPNDAWTKLNDRAWYAGIPIMVSGSPTGRDKAIYDFILARGTGPGLPQRTDIEAANGGMDDNVWLDYVAYRGSLIKNQMFRELSRLNRMDDDALVTALSRISNDATKKAKQQFRFK